MNCFVVAAVVQVVVVNCGDCKGEGRGVRVVGGLRGRKMEYA